MFRYKFPVFKSGKILSVEMLEHLQRYPENLLAIRYAEYSDGVINGCDFSYREDALYLERGLIKLNGKLFLLEEGERLPLPEDSGNYVIDVIYQGHNKGESFSEETAGVVIRQKERRSGPGKDDLGSQEGRGFELGSYGYTGKGAAIRCRYDRFSELDTPSNTINLINRKQACPSDALGTLPAVVAKLFAQEILTRMEPDPQDCAFAFACLNAELITRQAIQAYLALKFKPQQIAMDNFSIYKRFVDILGNKRPEPQRPFEGKKIMEVY